MKRIAQQVNLHGQHEDITMMELRGAPGDAVAQAAMGKTIGIMKNGVRVAQLGPLDAPTQVLPDGQIVGELPLTMFKDLGSHY